MSTPTIIAAPARSPKPPAASKAASRAACSIPKMLWKSLPDALRKLDPRTLWRNPVMFIVEIGAVWSTILAIIDPSWFAWLIVVWLWLTVIFANLAEAVAEGRGKAQAESLRRTKTDTMARRLVGWTPGAAGREEEVAAPQLQQGDIVVVEAGQIIPGDGDVVEGIASVDESAITGESAPVIRESGGDRSAVTGGTTVLSDRIVVKITQKPGESFIDRMIALVEGANRQKTPNEIALNILLAVADDHLRVRRRDPAAAGDLLQGQQPRRPGHPGAQRQRRHRHRDGRAAGLPDPDDDRRAAVGASASPAWTGWCSATCSPCRAARSRPPATSTRCCSTRPAPSPWATGRPRTFVPLTGVTRRAACRRGPAVQPRRRDAGGPLDRRVRQAGVRAAGPHAGRARRTRTGSSSPRPPGCPASTSMTVSSCARARPSSVAEWVRAEGGTGADRTRRHRRRHLRGGRHTAGRRRGRSTARPSVLGVIHLKDVVKQGMRERFDEMRRMGIRTVMITGDNPLTAKAIADEAGVDDFLAEATPEDKMALIKKEQAGGKLVAMTGDGTNDAPALAQADVGVAMNTGTSAAKEAGNMVDLDSDPTKLIEIVEIGKQLLITRGALTTFSIANDIAKYFAIIPAMFVALFPGLDLLNVMRLHSPQSAILSAVIFNAIVIIALIPLSLRGVRYTPSSASKLLSRNLYVYGLGGIIAPFIGIKLIDLVIQLFPGM